MAKPNPVASRLVEKLGCASCKKQHIEDDFLSEHSRFWCDKKKRTFCGADRAHQDCPFWTFSGDEALLDAINQPGLPGVE